jgi:peroxiredoxin Q/BCP
MKKSVWGILFGVPLLAAMAPGDAVTDFTAKDQDGKTVRLADLHGKFVLLYFYPKDDTPGCTKEACSFRDEYVHIKELNTVVYGVSTQGADSHQKFRAKHKLPFDLLVDEDGALAKKLGVDTMPIIGLAKRQSLLIGPDGKLVKFYGEVDPTGHVEQVMSDIKAAQSKAAAR